MAEAVRRIWLIGGTQESAQLAQAIAAHHLHCCVTVATEAARHLYPPSPTLDVWVGRLAQDELPCFLQQQQIGAILDASHPFAVEISRLAIAAAETYQIPYLRFERPPVSPSTDYPRLHTFETLEAFLNSGLLEGQRSLLTLGYRMLPSFANWHDRATLFARILPSHEALGAALASGFTPDRLIALRPPISAELERSLWRQWGISLVVTKASGQPGGEAIKQQVAQALDIPLVILSRPAIHYPHQTQNLEIALEFCQTSVR